MSDTPLVLSLETATLGGSVFLGRGEQQLAERIGAPEVSHSNSLLSDINECLQEGEVSLKEVELFACASGPGSFTGLRIGIATLKALAATMERACIGIPTLRAVARAAGASSGTVALLPAGRGEVFAQMFSVSEDDGVVEVDAAAHLSPERLMAKYGAFRELTWTGSGAHQHHDFLKNYAQQQGIPFTDHSQGSIAQTHDPNGNFWRLSPKETNLAKHVSALAVQLFKSGQVESPHSLSANYVRPSDAELKEQCR
ncbi:MAG: tRNA (adenosine(37)-N6)-threonylcarbamoyltransferase complex dimerization subunit type 1 TsaB [Pyrinomonadaceae bacterium]